MRSLPNLTAEQGGWRLPLCDATAARMACALLAETLDERRAQWAALLADDPWLTLWMLCRAHALRVDAGQSVAALAEFLAGHGLTALHWSGGASPDDPPSLRAASAELAQMAGRSVAVAELAANLATAAGSAPAREAYLLGLTHDAQRWLMLANEHSSAALVADLLPPWLVENLSLCSGQQPAPDGSAPFYVRQACEQLREGPHSDGQQDLSKYQQRAQAIVEQWFSSSDSTPAVSNAPICISSVLPLLVAKLSRLEQLERDFAKTLEAEKLESLKELAYGAGHEINNPLANISARAQTLLKEERDPERRRKLAAINTQAFRAHEMIADMMLFARPPQLVSEQLDLSALVERVLEEVRSMAVEQGTELTYARPEAPISICADKAQLAVAVRSLCRNALEALGGGGRVEVQLRESDDSGPRASREFSRGAQIVVSDNGPGFGPEVRKHLFDPFYSGREAGRGLGFGLSKCWRIARSHGGTIEVESAPGRGATFVIALPAEGPQSGPGALARTLAAAQ